MDVLHEIEALLARARRGGNPHRIKAAIEKVITEELPRLRQPRKARSHLEAVRRFAGNRRLTEISEVAWDYRAAHQHLSTATCNWRIAWLRRIARLAHRQWGWLARPIYISLHPEHNARHRYLTLAEVERLLDACDHRPTRDAVLLAVYTGMRQGEIFALDRTNVRGDCLSLPDRDSKNRDPRLIPILPAMIDTVARLPLPCKARTMYDYFKRACRRAKLEDLRFHDLRHTTASLLVNAGHSIKIVQEVLGHRSVQAANRYAHLSIETKRAALERVFGS
ncbi:MAG: site-specific integrase [Pseudomonadota bacterium]|nr:site-specific integrase [Pseudomonadota bacterium]